MIIPFPPLKWSVLYTGAYNTHVHTIGNVNTRPIPWGVHPHCRNLQPVHVYTLYICIC